MRGRKVCRHRDQSTFRVGAHEWRCSACGRIDIWRAGWQYLGAVGCRTCQREPAIEAVTCSDACRAQLEAA